MLSLPQGPGPAPPKQAARWAGLALRVLPCKVGGGVGLGVLRPQGVVDVLEVLQVGELRDPTGQHLAGEQGRGDGTCDMRGSCSCPTAGLAFPPRGALTSPEGGGHMLWAVAGGPQGCRGWRGSRTPAGTPLSRVA